MPEMRVVRNLRSGLVHVVEVESTFQYNVCQFLGSPFLGVLTPVLTECGTELRGKGSAAVCMEPGTKVKCARCRRISGIEQAPETNHMINGVDPEELWALAQGWGEEKTNAEDA
jgi:hypothetical protein